MDALKTPGSKIVGSVQRAHDPVGNQLATPLGAVTHHVRNAAIAGDPEKLLLVTGDDSQARGIGIRQGCTTQIALRAACIC